MVAEFLQRVVCVPNIPELGLAVITTGCQVVLHVWVEVKVPKGKICCEKIEGRNP